MADDSSGSHSSGSNTILHLGAAPVPKPKPRAKPRAPEPPAPTAEAPARFEPGQRVGKTPYRIVRFLGDGGMGAVYEAEHIHLERRVALKILLPEVCQNPQVLRLFRAEAKAASRIGSEHIIELYDFAELADGRLLFTMEMLSGPTLAEELQGGALAPSRVVAILRQLCKGLSAAHEAGIVHRDIKPDNVVLTTIRGRRDGVKILDFGIAAIADDEETSRPLQAGTPHYVAPELIQGAGFDDRADIYAVGCTAYTMLAGRPPFDATGPDALSDILSQHITDEPVPPQERHRELTACEGLCAVVLRCLAKLPAGRYSSIDELEADLCGAQIAGRIETNWDDLPLPEQVPAHVRDKLLEEMPTLDAFEPKRRPAWVWPAVAMLAIGVGIGGAYWGMSRGQSPEPAAATEAEDEDEYVAELAGQARVAATQGLYIYPPATDPSAATAYGRIRELEALEGDGAEEARRQARQLRKEFAAQLVRLGDEHFERPGGEAIAGDYYAQALLFDREHPRALERTSVADDQLAQMETKAKSGEFSTEEIEKAEVQRKRDRKVLASVREDPPDKTPAAATDDAAPAADAPVAPAEPKPPSEEAKSARALAKVARELYAKGDKTKAADFVSRALVFNPRDETALTVRYDLRWGKGDHAGALEVAKTLVSISGSRGAHQMRLGKAHAKLGQWTQAHAAYAKALALGTKGAEAALADAAAHGGGPPPGSEPAPADTKGDDGAPPDVGDADEGAADEGAADEEVAVPDPAPAPAPADAEDGA